MFERFKVFSRSPWGVAIWLGLALSLCTVGLISVRVFRALHPPREPISALDFRSMKLPVEAVRFDAIDGLSLAGWWIEQDPDAPTILLCHDVGQSKAGLVNVAIVLRNAGFNLLMFDFRGHGESDGAGSTLGILEKRDVIGALDWVARRQGGRGAAVGAYGVGMGAHAAVLAADDRPNLRVLVLDGLYADAGVPLSRRVFGGWPAATRWMQPLPRGIFNVVSGTRIDRQRAADRLGNLPGRHLLLMAPANDGPLLEAMKRMVQTIPEGIDSDGNLVILPATQGRALYGVHLDRYHRHVTEFFNARLG